MTKVFTVALNKGGVGKSTTTAYLGAALAGQGKRVLLIDLDAQRNMTDCFPPQTFGLAEAGNPDRHIGKVLTGEIPVQQGVYTLDERLDIIPSHKDLLDYEEVIANRTRREDILSKVLKTLKGSYDYILIDTPPHLGLMTYNALYASDYYIVPITPEYFSYDGIEALVRKANIVAEDTGLEFAGVLITRYNENQKGRALQAIAQVVKETPEYKTFRTYIRNNKNVGEAQMSHVDLLSFAPDCTAAKDYTNLSLELIERYG